LRTKAAKNKEIKLRVSLRHAPLISNMPEFDFSASPFQVDPTKWSVNFAFPRQFGSRQRTTVDPGFLKSPPFSGNGKSMKGHLIKISSIVVAQQKGQCRADIRNAKAFLYNALLSSRMRRR